jgi:hypothetical protein
MCENFVNSFVEKVTEKMKNPLKLYHVELPNDIQLGYDSYSDFITTAYSEEEARKTSPGSYGWTKEIDKLIVTEIGTASENVKSGVIMAHCYYG